MITDKKPPSSQTQQRTIKGQAVSTFFNDEQMQLHYGHKVHNKDFTIDAEPEDFRDIERLVRSGTLKIKNSTGKLGSLLSETELAEEDNGNNEAKIAENNKNIRDRLLALISSSHSAVQHALTHHLSQIKFLYAGTIPLKSSFRDPWQRIKFTDKELVLETEASGAVTIKYTIQANLEVISIPGLTTGSDRQKLEQELETVYKISPSNSKDNTATLTIESHQEKIIAEENLSEENQKIINDYKTAENPLKNVVLETRPSVTNLNATIISRSSPNPKSNLTQTSQVGQKKPEREKINTYTIFGKIHAKSEKKIAGPAEFLFRPDKTPAFLSNLKNSFLNISIFGRKTPKNEPKPATPRFSSFLFKTDYPRDRDEKYIADIKKSFGLFGTDYKSLLNTIILFSNEKFSENQLQEIWKKTNKKFLNDLIKEIKTLQRNLLFVINDINIFNADDIKTQKLLEERLQAAKNFATYLQSLTNSLQNSGIKDNSSPKMSTKAKNALNNALDNLVNKSQEYQENKKQKEKNHDIRGVASVLNSH